MAKVVVRALYPVMLAFIMEETTLLVMVQGATLAMDLAIIPLVVIPFAALLATTPAIVLLPAFMVREQFMMVPVVAPTAVITLHAMLWPVSLEKKQEASNICLFFLTILSSFTHLLRHCP